MKKHILAATLLGLLAAHAAEAKTPAAHTKEATAPTPSEEEAEEMSEDELPNVEQKLPGETDKSDEDTMGEGE